MLLTPTPPPWYQYIKMNKNKAELLEAKGWTYVKKTFFDEAQTRDKLEKRRKTWIKSASQCANASEIGA